MVFVIVWVQFVFLLFYLKLLIIFLIVSFILKKLNNKNKYLKFLIENRIKETRKWIVIQRQR